MNYNDFKERIWPMRKITLLCLLAATLIFTGCSKKPDEPDTVDDNSQLRIIFFDVGKADCILISRNSHHILIDTGTASSAAKVIARLNALKVE